MIDYYFVYWKNHNAFAVLKELKELGEEHWQIACVIHDVIILWRTKPRP